MGFVQKPGGKGETLVSDGKFQYHSAPLAFCVSCACACVCVCHPRACMKRMKGRRSGCTITADQRQSKPWLNMIWACADV